MTLVEIQSLVMLGMRVLPPLKSWVRIYHMLYRGPFPGDEGSLERVWNNDAGVRHITLKLDEYSDSVISRISFSLESRIAVLPLVLPVGSPPFEDWERF